jgi:hypothetical protein
MKEVGPMATTIRLACADTIEVDEEIAEVLRRWTTSGGEPFGVTIDGEQAYVSPTQVACIHEGV